MQSCKNRRSPDVFQYLNSLRRRRGAPVNVISGQDAIAALHRAGLTKSAQVQQLKVRANQVTGYKWHVRLTGTRLAET